MFYLKLFVLLLLYLKFIVCNIDPFIGTGGGGYGIGSTPPGAQYPFSFVRLSPDTAESFDVVLPWRHFGGYHFDDKVIRAFTHVHMQGAGAVDLGVIGVMPIDKTFSNSESVSYITGEKYRQEMLKSSEKSTPGFYSIEMSHGKVAAQLTANRLFGVHRYSFSNKANEATLLFLPSITIEGEKGHRNVSIEIDPNLKTISGYIQVYESLSRRKVNLKGNHGEGLKIFFFGKILTNSASLLSYGVWNEKRFSEKSLLANAKQHETTGAWFSFNKPKGQTFMVDLALGISLISINNAKRSLNDCNGFDPTLKEAQAAWQSIESKIVLKTPSTNEKLWKNRKTIFETALYHNHAAPTNYTEDCGKYACYVGMNDTVHRIARGQAYFSDMSIWDIYRTQTPFLSLTSPKLMSQIAQSLINMYIQGGALPRWPLATVYTGCMVGSHANIILADAFFRDVPNINYTLAFEAMFRAVRDTTLPFSARDPQLLDAWLNQGFLPDNIGEGRTAARALDWAYDDGVTASMAFSLGFKQKANDLLKTSLNYRNHWSDKHKLFCPRHDSPAKFSCPNEVDSYFPFSSQYVEDNAQVYSYYVPHDVPGLIALNGGNESFVKRLELFAERTFDDTWTGLPNPFIWIGNEPSLLIPWLFNFAGRADLTQKYTHRIANVFFTTGVDGLPGNDDYGAISTWLLWSMIGLYPLSGSDVYIVGAPMFEQLDLQLGDTKTLSVRAHNFKSDGSSDVAMRAALNGAPLDMQRNAFVKHRDLIAKRNNILEFWFE